jgi:hypothetical protein
MLVVAFAALGFALPGPLGSARAWKHSMAGIRMMSHGRVYETPDVPAECLLLPKEPFPGEPQVAMVGEVMLQELEDDEETRTQLFFNADGTVGHGATDGPPPAGFCGLWQCGEDQFQMTLSRAFSSATKMLDSSMMRGQMTDDIVYSVVRVYIGAVTKRDSGVGVVNGRIELVKDADAAQWSGSEATSIQSFDPFSDIAETPIGYFVLDTNTNVELTDAKPGGGVATLKGAEGGSGEAASNPAPTGPYGRQQAVREAEWVHSALRRLG